MVARNVAALQRAPKVPVKRPDIIRKDQLDDVVAKLRDTAIFPKAMLALFCGLRAGEVLALSWNDIQGDMLTVAGSVEEVPRMPLQIKRPKTEAGRRTVTLPSPVVTALQEHKVKQLKQRLAFGQGKLPDDALVFPNKYNGGIARRTGLSIEWAKTVKALGLPPVTFHGLRHTMASALVDAGLPVTMIASRMGHASAAVTLRVYSHLYPKDDRAAAEAIERMIRPLPAPKPA